MQPLWTGNGGNATWENFRAKLGHGVPKCRQEDWARAEPPLRVISHNVNVCLPPVIIVTILNKWCTERKRKEILKKGQIIKTNWGVDGGIHRVNSVWHCGPITHTLKRDCLFSSIHIQLLRDIHKLKRNAGSLLYLWKTAPQLGKVSRCLFDSGVFFFGCSNIVFFIPYESLSLFRS